MHTTTAHTIARTTKCPRLAAIVRVLRTTALIIAALIAGLGVGANAQSAPERCSGIELRPFVGAFIPTGGNADPLESAVLAGGQLSYGVVPALSVVGTFGWALSADRTTWSSGGRQFSGQDVDLFQYDLGLEGRLRNSAGTSSITVGPFASLGAGGRTINYRDLDAVDAQTNVVGFAGVSADIGPSTEWWGVRLEARDYVSGFKGLRAELPDRKARNDVTLAVGVTIRAWGGVDPSRAHRRVSRMA